MFSSDTVFKNRQHSVYGGKTHELTERAYIAVLGLYVVAGLALSALAALWSYSWPQPDITKVLIVGLVIPVIGIIISAKSTSWEVSTFGYGMVVIPFGLLLGPVVALYEQGSVIRAVVITLGVTLVMWIIGLISPPILTNLSGLAIGAILVLIFAPLSGFVFEWMGAPPLPMNLWMWLGAILFTGLIFYDVNKAMQQTRTLDNAVDAAVGIYLDIINLFIRILQLMGNKDSD